MGRSKKREGNEPYAKREKGMGRKEQKKWTGIDLISRELT
jgi:hypothetical protein